MAATKVPMAQRTSVLMGRALVQLAVALGAGIIALFLARLTGFVLPAYIVCGVFVLLILFIRGSNWLGSLILGFVVAAVMLFVLVPVIDMVAQYRLYILVGLVVLLAMRTGLSLPNWREE